MNDTTNSTPPPPAMRATRHMIINRCQLRRYALEAAAQRHHRFTRVGVGFYVKADAQLRAWTRSYIAQLPSVGKTIK